VTSRVAVVLLSVVAVVLSGTAVARSSAPLVGSSVYVVRPDPRLCPSPLCGGYWVALANHARTTCHDDALRPRCYVARIVDEDRHPAGVDVPAGSLVRADIEPGKYEGFGELGVLVVAGVFSPAGTTAVGGSFFRLVDTGIRCIRAPCFSFRAAQLNQSTRTTLSGIDLGSAHAAPEEVVRAETALHKKTGLLAQGRIVRATDGGRVFRATRLFLRSER
jgi:hypothetical protein